MPMKTKHSRKRLLAGVLALVMAFGLAAGAVPGIGGGIVKTVEAANGTADTIESILGHGFTSEKDDKDGNPAGYSYAGNGRIVIQMLDSSVPGADVSTWNYVPTDLNAPFQEAFGSGFKMWGYNSTDAAKQVTSTRQLLPLAEGLARMDGRPLLAYDVTNMIEVGDNNNFEWSTAALQAVGFTSGTGASTSQINAAMAKYIIWNENYGNVPYFKIAACLDNPRFKGLIGAPKEVKYSTMHTEDGRSYMVITKDDNDWLVDGGQYVFVEKNDLSHMYYGYMPNVGGDHPDTYNDKAWQLYIHWGEEDGKNPDIHVTYDTDNASGGWNVADHGAGGIGRNDRTQPLHNEVMRGGFKFRVANMETGSWDSGPGAGDMSDSVFAVFNINYLAQSPYAYTLVGDTPMPIDGTPGDTTKGYGYITVDADGNGTIDLDNKEAVTCFPAYRPFDVIQAWKNYLKAGTSVKNGAKLDSGEDSIYWSYLVNGAYGVKIDDDHDYTTHDIGANEGLFQMGTTNKGVPIVPCLVLKTDKNGYVSTPGAYSLPVGNYLVLQIKAGDGMYVDENFQPIVSIGPWDANGGTVLGYGNAAISALGVSLESSRSMSQTKGLFVAEQGVYNPVAYVNSSNLRGDDPSIPDISTLGSGDCFFISRSLNYYHNYTTVVSEPNAKYDKVISLPAGESYAVNMNNGKPTTNVGLADSIGNRRIPNEGYSRFIAYQTPVRGGVKFYIGDADDVAAVAKIDKAATSYTAEPQGDGELSGAVFRVYNTLPQSFISSLLAGKKTATVPFTVNAGIEEYGLVPGVKAEPQIKALAFGDRTTYQDYMVYKEAGTGRYFLEIPVDELPFGAYEIKQITTGLGYGSWAGKEDPDWNAMSAEDFTVTKLVVFNENYAEPVYDSNTIKGGDSVLKSDDVKKAVYEARVKYAIGATEKNPDNFKIGNAGTVYVPQTIVRGGYTISASGDDSFDGSSVKVTIKVFNISDHYVYVDKEGHDDVAEKYPTSKSAYNQYVRGKALSVSDINRITSAWPSCVAELTDMSLGEIRHEIGLLPFGTYLIAVTGVTDGYTPVNSVFVTDRIEYEDDEIQYSVKILDSSRIPLMTTTLLDNGYQLDSVPWKANETLVDTVDMSNLQDNTTYTLYGMLVDAGSGEMIPGTGVSVVENISGYQAPVNGDGTENVDNGAVQANLRDLLTKGETYSSGISDLESYGVWLYNMQDFAAACKDTILPGLVNSSISNFQSAGNNVTTYLQRYHTPLVARLRYLAGDTAYGGTGAADLTGRQTVKLYYNNLMARNDAKKENDLEGRTMVSVVILCEGGKQPDALTATDLGSLMALTNGTSVAIRNDLNDEEETVRVAALDITAVASYSGGKQLDPSETVLATVAYGNMEPGIDYNLTVKLRDENGAWVVDTEGKEMEISTGTFRATQTADTFQALFEGLDVAKYNNQRLTAFARLDRVTSAGNTENGWWLIEKGDAATMGYSAGDAEPGKNQVDIVAPTVRTVLADKYGSKEVDFDHKVTLVDEVEYTRLVAGGRYESVMTLVDATGVTLKDDAGNDLVFTQQFTVPETNTDGKFSVKIEATFDGTGLLGQKIVSFNDLYHITPDRKAHVGYEHELTAVEQTILATGESVRILFSTVARDDNSNTHYVPAGADTPFTDVVTIRNLTPTEKYVLKTEIASANTGKVLSQMSPVYTQVSADEDGDIYAEVKMNINTNAFKGQALVIYQTLYDAKEKEVIAQHADNTDRNQMLYVADADTVATGENGRAKRIHPNLVEDEEVSSATVDGQHHVTVTKSYSYQTTIMDRVYYSNLVPGNEYKVTTEVVTQKGGREVGSTSQNYTPTEPNGSFTAFIDIDVTDFLGEELVVYETITDLYNNQVVVTHKDLDDKDQTVRIMASAEDDPDDPANDPDDPNDPNNPNNPNANDPNTGKNIQTGVAEHYPLYFALAALLLVLAGAGGFWYFKKRK